MSVGSVSTLIEPVLSTEWQCLKNKTGMYTESNHDFKMSDAFGTYEGCSNMNASSFILSSHICYDKMSYLPGKDYLSPLRWH